MPKRFSSNCRVFFVTTLISIITLFAAETKSAPLEIRGQISARVYRDSSIINIASNWFVVTIDDKNTRIKAGPMGDPAIIDFEYGLLDKDSYLLINYVTNLLVTEINKVVGGVATKVKLRTPQKAQNTAMIFLNNGRTPGYVLGMISPVWMAYCFHLDLPNSETTRIQGAPIFSMGKTYRQQGGLAEITYTLNSQSPFFLQTLVETGDSKQFETLKMPPPLRGVFTNATYNVLRWTNVASYTVPQQFYITNYFVMGATGLADVEKIVFEGTATDFLVNVPSVPVINIPLVTRAVERRSGLVAPLSEFSYTTTNGILLSREKVVQHEDFIVELSERPGSTPWSNSKNRLIIRVAFVALIVLPLIVWWFTRRKSRR